MKFKSASLVLGLLTLSTACGSTGMIRRDQGVTVKTLPGWLKRADPRPQGKKRMEYALSGGCTTEHVVTTDSYAITVVQGRAVVFGELTSEDGTYVIEME